MDFSHPSPPPPTPGSGSRVRDMAVSPVSLGSPWNLPVFNRACTSCCLLQSPSTINQARKPFPELMRLLVCVAGYWKARKGRALGTDLHLYSVTSPLQEVRVCRVSILGSSELCIAESQRDRQTG